MHLPDQRENLEELARSIAEGVNDTANFGRDMFLARVKCFDAEAMKPYFAEALAQENCADMIDRIDDLKQDPRFPIYDQTLDSQHHKTGLQKAFRIINHIIKNYLEDLGESAKDAGIDETQSAAIMLSEAANLEEMVKILVPELAEIFHEQKTTDITAENTAQGIQMLRQAGIFKGDRFGCPITRRFPDILALNPIRDFQTGEVTITEGEPGALPVFIYNELKQAGAEPAPAEEAMTL